MYKNLKKINDYYLSPGSRQRWEQKLLELSAGKSFAVHETYFQHHNPLVGLRDSMAWIAERYKPAFDYLDKRRTKRILEIGCAHGLSTWLLTDIADEVWGVDISPGCIDIAKALFPEVRFHSGGFQSFFKEYGDRFDVVIDCYGPWGDELQSVVMDHCDTWVHIGYRTQSLAQLVTWSNKLKGRHLSFESTAVGQNQRGLSPSYPKHFFSKRYLQHLKHSLMNHYWPQF